jgi:hypothetical protein
LLDEWLTFANFHMMGWALFSGPSQISIPCPSSTVTLPTHLITFSISQKKKEKLITFSL